MEIKGDYHFCVKNVYLQQIELTEIGKRKSIHCKSLSEQIHKNTQIWVLFTVLQIVHEVKRIFSQTISGTQIKVFLTSSLFFQTPRPGGSLEASDVLRPSLCPCSNKYNGFWTEHQLRKPANQSNGFQQGPLPPPVGMKDWMHTNCGESIFTAAFQVKWRNKTFSYSIWDAAPPKMNQSYTSPSQAAWDVASRPGAPREPNTPGQRLACYPCASGESYILKPHETENLNSK